MGILVVGLGNVESDLTLRGAEAIRAADMVIMRTEKTAAAKTLAKLGIKYITLDNLYEQYEDFDALNLALADKVIELAQGKNAVYCVEGCGIDDSGVRILNDKINIQIISGVSRENGALAQSLQFVNSHSGIMAVNFVADRAFFAPSSTLVIKEIDNAFLASDVKLKLIELYGEIEVYYVVNNKAVLIACEDLDRQKTYNYSSAVVVPEQSYSRKKRFSFGDLMALVYRLRAKDGCKWDREQTHKSIRINCIEEAYELVEAIDLEDIDKMLEETGDVLLQGVFHAIIAEDTAEYTITDVLTVLCRKLLDRHTHIFGDVVANTPEEALAAWESAKAKEKKQESYTERMSQVAANLPALIRAQKISKIRFKSAELNFTNDFCR
ncbi:MAG: hypothetical protein EOM87_08470 [Clostridia bacterium]|nr:hypothetical protein [Clostridia bacterium]